MGEEIQLIVVTPEKLLFDDRVENVIVKGSEGEMGIYYDHAPLATRLGIGILQAQAGKDYYSLAISGGGYLEVLPTQVTILADTGERPEEIDVERAERAKERAEERLSKAETDPDVDFIRARAALQRAITRIRTVSGE